MDFRLTDGDQNFWWILFVYCRIQNFWHEKKWLCSWTNGSGFPMNTDDLSRYCSLGHPRWTLSQHRRPSLGFLPYCVSGPWWVTPFLWLFANGCSGGCAKSEKNPCQTSHAKQMATHSQRGNSIEEDTLMMIRWPTVFEHCPKSRIQYFERREPRLHFEWKWSILASFWKPEACGQTVLQESPPPLFNWPKIGGKCKTSNATHCE